MNGASYMFFFLFMSCLLAFTSPGQVNSTDTCDPPTEFKCHTANKCIKKHLLCDGFNDCPDSSDESSCQWCNRTFEQQDETVTTKTGRFVIMSAQNLNQSQPLNCFYTIINNKPDLITSIRLRKFSIGHFNVQTRECEDAWIEIKERDHDEDIIIQVSKSFTEPPGRFCGTLQNFRNTYYSSKQLITISYFISANTSANSFEFEVSFYKKQAISVVGKSVKPGGEMDHGTALLGCDRSFDNCDDKICALSSPGYPGIFLKNLKCRFSIQNQRLGKLILINDNLQLDAKLCHFNHSNSQLATSFFCDSGVRSSINCLDTVDLTLNATSTFVRDVCGLGRMNKIVVSNARLLSIDFQTGRQGYFANTGFLFYALGIHEYSTNFGKYNDLTGATPADIDAVEQLDSLQVSACNSDANECTIRVDEASVRRVAEQRFRIGYLFGLNQYHSAHFKLNYEIRASRFNTIAVYLIKYEPHAFVAASQCQVNYLSIEAPVRNGEKQQMSSVFKICQPDELTNKTVRLFLVKAARAGRALPDLNVQYYALRESLAASELFDFKLSYEFLDFDWTSHVTGTVCDFEYRGEAEGQVANPKASIFYRYQANSGDSGRLNCRYRLVAGPNQYVRLTIRRIDFNLGDCVNVYFHQAHSLKYERCESLQRKLKISDSFYAKESDQMDLRMCVCSLNAVNQVYISKSNVVDIEYDIRLDSLGEGLDNIDFEVDYEFVERGCEGLVVAKLGNELKGSIAYRPETSLGVQAELVNVFAEVSIKTSSEYKQYVDMLRANRNFHCRFRLQAPINHFAYVELVDFSIGKNCEQNAIRLFSNFSGERREDEVLVRQKAGPFIRLCNLDNPDLVDLPNRIGSGSSMITAFFSKETTVSRTLSCYKSNNKVCFMTNELENKMNPFTAGSAGGLSFFNEVIIEVEASNLDEMFYEVRYHYFTIAAEAVDDGELVVTSKKQAVKTRSGQEMRTDCDFRCPEAVSNSNRSVDVCVSGKMVCDGEIDCIFNDADELNCPAVLKEKSILILLCGLFVFTLCVLVVFCVFKKSGSHYRKSLNAEKSSQDAEKKFETIKYSHGLQKYPN